MWMFHVADGEDMMKRNSLGAGVFALLWDGRFVLIGKLFFMYEIEDKEQL